MDDKPDHEGLYRLAEEQAGFFTVEQAQEYGFSRALLSHHSRSGGRFERSERGFYRLRLFPSSPHDEVVRAWLAVGPEVAVVSHESALDVYGLADVIPSAVHLTVPRSHRWKSPPKGVRLHTTTKDSRPEEIRRWSGVRVTSPERTLIDLVEAALSPDQLALAYRQALARGLLTPQSLSTAIAGRAKSTQSALRQLMEETA